MSIWLRISIFQHRYEGGVINQTSQAWLQNDGFKTDFKLAAELYGEDNN